MSNEISYISNITGIPILKLGYYGHNPDSALFCAVTSTSKYYLFCYNVSYQL